MSFNDIDSGSAWYFKTSKGFHVALELFYMQFRTIGLLWNFGLMLSTLDLSQKVEKRFMLSISLMLTCLLFLQSLAGYSPCLGSLF